MMKQLVFIALVFLAVLPLSAQIVNIENKRIYDDTSGWSGSLDGGFSVVQNGPLFYSANFRPRVQYKTRKNYYLLLSDIAYTGSKSQTYANSGMSHFRYARRIKNGPWKWESFAQVQYNLMLNQKIRTLAGTGLRWKFIDTNNCRFFVGSSLFAEYEELQSDGLINKDVRWSNYLSWFINLKSGFSFTAVTYFQPVLNRMKDVRFSGQYSIGMAVTKRVDMRFEYNIFYDSNPPTNIRRMVFSSSAGFRVKLGE
jgi:hypothetical protein